MLYFIQDSQGSVIQTVGTEVVNGVATPIPSNQMVMKQLAFWHSPNSSYTYPSLWKIIVPDGAFLVNPVIQNQELIWPDHRTYFEADSEVFGFRNGRAVGGVGYTEVNPYFEPGGSLP
jgi:predicted secreted hydrolase